MTHEEKNRLSVLLADAQSATRATVAGLDLEMPVHSDSGWTVADILGHVATWDREATKSLQAYGAGSEYTTPDLDETETGFNQRAVQKLRTFSSQQLLEEWELARHDFIQAVQAIPLEMFPGDVLYPWGSERGTISKLVEYMVEHDVEHRNEILGAL
jgi:uncharacterized damage-inducible protein DinB